VSIIRAYTAVQFHLIFSVCRTLEKASVVKAPAGGFKVEDFVNTEVVKLVSDTQRKKGYRQNDEKYNLFMSKYVQFILLY